MEDRARARPLRSCDGCRAAHAKCDCQLPSCGRCICSGITCVRGPAAPFRYSNTLYDSDSASASAAKEGHPVRGEFDFDDDQVWLPSHGNFEFVIETLSPEADEAAAPLRTPISEGECNSPATSVSRQTQNAAEGIVSSPVEISLSHASETALIAQPLGDTEQTQFDAVNHVLPLSPLSPIQSRDCEFEANLLHYFISTLSCWFDYCDPQRTFGTSVVQRAVVSPWLRSAILATSSRHMSLVRGDGLENHLADDYHRQCLELLIPRLDDGSAALDEDLYAATVILRLYEEISVPLEGRDYESHLNGAHTFARAQETFQSFGIRHAVFRVILRQEIVNAFINQRPVQLLREYITADQSVGYIDDSTLAFRIIILCAKVLTYCYGAEPQTRQAWDQLDEQVMAWETAKPLSFEPLFYRGTGEGQPLPRIMLLNDCHVAARQHYHVCRLLLEAHNPRRRPLGPGRLQAAAATDAIMKDHIRDVCGTAVSNPHCVNAMFTASMVVGICGDLFSDKDEQTALFDVLYRTDRELAWPTLRFQTALRQSWGWD